MANHKKTIFFLMGIALIFIIDRYTKFIASFVSGCFILCIKYSVNFGAAFALFSQSPWIRSLLIIFALIVLFLICFFYFKIPGFNLMHIGLVLLFAGTLGNLYDRIIYGYVIDFITFSFLQAFPTFNIADVCNVAGVILLIISLYWNQESSDFLVQKILRKFSWKQKNHNLS